MSKKLFKRVILGLSIIFITLIVSVVIFFSVAYNKSKLDIDKLTTANTGIKLYASSFTNEETDYSYNLNRKIININQLPSYTINAFVAIEDKRFYKHNGYDIKRIAKSALVNIKDNNKTQGASTITQQLVKNTLLSNEKTYKRKLKEVMLSMKVEKNFTKDEIMNMYLNTIYFGSSAYGIENASQIYFNKSATDLTLNESAILAGLIKSPNNYSPKYNLENCFKRKNLVLTLMYQQGYINKAEYEKALIEKVDCTEISNSYDNSFYQQALIEACNILNISEKELIRNNYTIITHMDYDLQSKLNQILSNENIDADKLSIVVNPKGEVLAYLGISDFNLTDMKRSPASSLKPLAVYLPAIQHNIVDCSTPILDEETMFGDYKPRNTSDKYYGWTTVADSLAKSLNIPTVKLVIIVFTFFIPFTFIVKFLLLKYFITYCRKSKIILIYILIFFNNNSRLYKIKNFLH